MVNMVRYSRRDLLSIAGLVASLNVDGHRADLVILRGAQAHAALQGRDRVTDEDIVLAAELALPHRVRGRMFQDTVMSAQELSERLSEVQGEMGISDMGEREEETSETAATGKKKS
jgi:Mg-chelatase subunit ChlI